MISFRQTDDDHPALFHSPMVHAIEKIFDYVNEHGSVPLTPQKAFKRVFVNWAAAQFNWPGYSENDLFAINKVLNEIDFPPLMDIHDLMMTLKIGRHHKSSFKLTKAGRTLEGHPGRLFDIVAPFYLFEVDHLRFGRVPERLFGNWDIFLNVLNVTAEDGITGLDLRRELYGEPEAESGFDTTVSSLYVQVLRPLCWTGLLQEQRQDGFKLSTSFFTKTPLWRATLRLNTDDMVQPAVRH
jgi:hypothetical protein